MFVRFYRVTFSSSTNIPWHFPYGQVTPNKSNRWGLSQNTSFHYCQKNKKIIKILMSKFLGQNIYSRTKMPQVGFQSIRKIRAAWSCPWLLLLFQLGIQHDRHRKSTWNISAPNMKQMRSNEMVVPQTPSIHWKPSGGVTKEMRHFCFCKMLGVPFQLKPQPGSSSFHRKEQIIVD